MTAPLRVVFDTNAFTRDNFDVLAGSPMRKLCAAGRLTPIYGHVFLEETFRAYGSENKRQDLIERWLPFISGTADRLCDDFLGIWHKELVQGRGVKTNIFMAPKDQETLLRRLPNIPLDGSWRAWQESTAERLAEDVKREAQFATSKAMRKEVSDWRKMMNYRPKQRDTSRLDEFFEREVDGMGRQFLTTLVRCWNPVAVADRWAKSKMQYPYFTMFVINMCYAAHHAMSRHNDKVDLNAQADLDLMTHLLHADALVSNEQGFLRQAFEDLWKPKGKVVFTSHQFADFIRKL